MKITVNVNTSAEVTLTKPGADIINDYFRQFHLRKDEAGKKQDEEWFPTNYKEGDTYKSELHQIMHIFGNNLIPGPPTPFKNNEITILC